MSQLGRISGQLLKENLTRNGHDLTFDDDLLHLDVTNRRVGIKKTNPAYELDVNGTTQTTDLRISGTANIGDLTITGETITSNTGILNLTNGTGDQVTYQSKLRVDSIDIENNVISTNSSNTNLVINPAGSGSVEIFANTNVYGDIYATGNIRADGNITIGDANTDNITINADIASNIIPNVTDTYTLGNSSFRWKDAWIKNIYADAIDTGEAIIDGVTLNLTQGNIYYVATNGDNTNAGEHQNDPVATIKHALTLATAGDTVYIYPGTYTELFPLTVPAGVTVKGSGIRAVKIIPDSTTTGADAFLLNGETTIEDLTVADFYSPGYAFKFASGMTVTSRSPYIRNVTVITKGTTITLSDPRGFASGDAGGGAYIDGSVVNAASKEASMLFHSVTFLCPGVDTVVATNGVRIEWLNSFTYFSNRSMYLISGSTGFAGDGKTRIKINNRTGTFAAGNTLTYYDTDGTTVLASGTIESVDGNFFVIDGKSAGWEIPEDRAGKTVSVNGDAKLSTAQKKFGTASLVLDGTGDYASLPSQPDFALGYANRLPKIITVTGDATISATQSKFGGSSIALDGTGDYLSLASTTDFGWGTGDFTIEGWFYKNSASQMVLFDQRTSGASQLSVYVESNAAGNLRLFVNGSYVLTSSNAMTTGAWNHVAISRASGTTRFFINGTVSTNTYADTNNYGSAKPLVIGATWAGSTAFNGYVDEIRVSNSARYTTTFTPSVSAFTHDSNSVLLIHGDTGVLDDTGDQYVGTFALEAWVYRTNSGNYRTIFDMRSAATDIAVFLGIDNIDRLYCYLNGSIVMQGTTAITLNTWTHVAITKQNNSLRMFLNGVQEGTTYTDTNNYAARQLRIGADWQGLFGFTGYIDDVRVSKGVSRYTSNFTAPTAAFLGDTSTVLLLHFDGANNSTIFLDDGITFQDIRTSAGGTASIIDVVDYADFGAEVRSIGSAAVYGNYGIYGDGDGVIAYLIGQNLAYIGNGKETTNDPNTVIQANEVVELNRAKIYYNSVDHKGDFRVGDLFYVNQATGEVSFTNSSVTIGTSLTFNDGLGNITYIDATKIETGDFRISDNTVETLTQDFDIQAASNLINLNSNVSIAGNLDVAGDVTVGGNVVIGNQNTDTVKFIAGVNSDILPKLDATYDLGTSLLRWKTLFATQLDSGDVRISTNIITTFASNSDLILQSSGTGKIYVPGNNVEFDQNLTVNGTTYLKNTEITGNVTQTGNVIQTGNITQTGDTTQIGNIELTGWVQFPDIRISGNTIETTQSNSNLTLDAAGTGKIYVPFSDVQIDQDLNVVGNLDVGSLTVDTSITSSTATIGDIKIETNYITTLTGNNDLELRAAGTGRIYVPQDNVEIDNNLTVDGTTNLAVTNITGTLTHIGNLVHTGDVNQTGNTTITGSLTVSDIVQFTDIKISGNTIETTIGNNDLQLEASGTGKIYVPFDDVQFDQDLTVLGNINTGSLSVNTSITSASYTAGDVKIETNVITTLTGNNDLELRAAGTGRIYVPQDNVEIDNNLTVDGTTNLANTNITGTITHIGNVTHTGDLNQTGNTTITGSLTVTDTIQFTDIKISGNTIETTIGNNDLRLEAAGTGRIYVPLDNVQADQTLTVVGLTTTSNITNSGTVTSSVFTTGDIRINTNVITTTVTNSNLVIEAAGTGIISMPSNDVVLGKTINVTGLSTLAATNITGTLTHVGNTTRTGDVNQTGNYSLTGNLTVTNDVQLEDIRIAENEIKTTVGNNNLILSAAGTGSVVVPSDNVQINQNLSVTGTTTTTNIVNSGQITSGSFSTGDILISGNTVRTTQSNSNLQLLAAGTGYIQLEQFDVQENVIRINTGSDLVIQPNGTGIVNIDSTQSLKIPVGVTGDRPLTPAAGMIRFNTTLNRYEGYNGTNWIRIDGVEDADGNTYLTAELTPGANDNTFRFVVDGTQVADLNSTRLNVINVDVDSININNNTISTSTSNTDLVVSPNGTGSLRIGNFAFRSNLITNTVNNSVTLFNQTGNGYVKINSTGGFVIPVGTTEQRPALFDVGMMRFNTTDQRVEIWDGALWVGAGQGAGGGVSAAEAQDIGIVSAIIFG